MTVETYHCDKCGITTNSGNVLRYHLCVPKEDKIDYDTLKKAEIVDLLDEKGVEHDKSSLKAELLELLKSCD